MIDFIFTKTPLMFFVQSFWRDEAFSYLLSKKNIIDILIITVKDSNPPLYYLLLHFWAKIFGNSEVALRSLSLIFFWATGYLIYLSLKRILKLSDKKAFIYLIFFVANPLFIYYAFEARMYSMFLFLAMGSFYTFYLRQKKLYFFTTILGLYTHYFMLLVLLTQFLFLIITEKNKKSLVTAIKFIVYSFIPFIPWIIFLFLKKPFLKESFWVQPQILKDLLYLPATLYTGYEKDLGFLNLSSSKYVGFFTAFSLILISLTFIGYLKVKKNKKNLELLIFLILWSFFSPLIIFLISFIKPMFVPRYLIFCTSGLILLLIFFIEKFRPFYKIVILITILFFTFNYQQIQINKRTKANIRTTIKQIKIMAKKGDLLYVLNELDFHTAEYYFDENRVFIYGKSYDQLPWYIGKILIPKEKIATSLPLYPKKAFILKDDGSYYIQGLF